MTAARSYLILELCAPLMSIGGPRIDGKPMGYPVPTKAMVTGLVANAAGVDRTEVAWLQAWQDRHRPGVRGAETGRGSRRLPDR